MSNQLFTKAYEDYLISGKEDSINSLPSGSLEKEYFFLIKQLLKDELTPELETQIESFTKKIPVEQSYRLRTLHIFKKLEKNPEKKAEIIKEIKDLFHLGDVTNYPNPMKYNNTIKKEKEDIEINYFPSQLNLKDIVFVDKYIEDIYSGKILPNNNKFKEFFMNKEIDLKLDFNKMPKEILINIFTLDEYSKILKSLQSSFKTANISYFKEVIKSVVHICLKEEKKKEYFKTIITKTGQYLFTEQLEYLLTFYSDFNFKDLLYQMIIRKYPIKIKDTAEAVLKLKEIKEILIKCGYKYNIMTRKILLSIMQLNFNMNIYDLDIFLEYIKIPLNYISYIYNITPELEKKLKEDDNENEIFDQRIPYNENKLIDKYLNILF